MQNKLNNTCHLGSGAQVLSCFFFVSFQKSLSVFYMMSCTSLSAYCRFQRTMASFLSSRLICFSRYTFKLGLISRMSFSSCTQNPAACFVTANLCGSFMKNPFVRVRYSLVKYASQLVMVFGGGASTSLNRSGWSKSFLVRINIWTGSRLIPIGFICLLPRKGQSWDSS